jgi:uncharacterized protein YegP (UPF0339 family)
MGTAPKKSRAACRLAGHARDVRVPGSMEFLISGDNGGAYQWTIVACEGATLEQSGSFASYDDAEQAAQRVRDGAASARPIRRGRETGAGDRAARRYRPGAELDAERWLDEGDTSTGEAVARWPNHC